MVAQAGKVVAGGVHANGDRDIVDFLRREDFLRVHFPGIKDLATQRQNRLKLAITRLLRRPSGRIALHQEEFAPGWVFAGTIRQLAGQSGARRHLFARDFPRGP